jgi:hypothetical protein
MIIPSVAGICRHPRRGFVEITEAFSTGGYPMKADAVKRSQVEKETALR